MKPPNLTPYIIVNTESEEKCLGLLT